MKNAASVWCLLVGTGELPQKKAQASLRTPKGVFDLEPPRAYNLTVLFKGVNWIRRGSRGCRGMPSAPRLEKIVELTQLLTIIS